MLDALGASSNIKPEEIFRAADGHAMQHRNGRTGELVAQLGQGGISFHCLSTLNSVLCY